MYRRLYLDLGDLIDIGDGRAADRVVADLQEAMIETDTKLVVSADHIQDVWRARPDAVESFVRAVESFQPVLAVMRGPISVEPLTSERKDIEVALCTNFRELVYSDAAHKPLDTLTDAYDRIHSGSRAVQRALSSAPLLPIRSRDGNRLGDAAQPETAALAQAVAELARGALNRAEAALHGGEIRPGSKDLARSPAQPRSDV